MNLKMLEGKEIYGGPVRLDYAEVKDILSSQSSELDIRTLGESSLLELKENFEISELESTTQTLLNSAQIEIPVEFGVWFYFPWRNAILQTLPENDFWKLRTVRNRFKITLEEQEVLRTKEISIIGLSAGNAVLQVLSMEGVGGVFNIFDFDRYEISNSNRLSHSLFDIGMEKVFLSSRDVWERNPFIKINLFRDGFKGSESDLAAIGRSDLIVDECDSFQVKINLRNIAKDLQKPLLMHTSEKGITDIERYDSETISIFNGLLDGVDLNNPREILTSIINPNIVSERMLFSFSEIGKSIKSWPQLASEVIAGGANVTTIARWILLGEAIRSGRYLLNCDSVRD